MKISPLKTVLFILGIVGGYFAADAIFGSSSEEEGADNNVGTAVSSEVPEGANQNSPGSDEDPWGGDDTPWPDTLVTVEVLLIQTPLWRTAKDTLAVIFSMEPGWHIYWRGKNDSGLFPSVTWTVPRGVRVGDLVWPTPKRKPAPGNILDHVYEDKVALLVPISIVRGGPLGDITLEAKIDMMACREACVPESARVSVTLPVVRGSEAQPSDRNRIAEVVQARKKLPRPQKQSDGLAVTWEDNLFKITSAEAQKLVFYPKLECSELANPTRDAEASGATLSLEFSPPVNASTQVEGILEVQKSSGTTYIEVSWKGP